MSRVPPSASEQQTPLDVLRRVWGYNEFRPLQSEIIHSVLEGKDTLGLLPTGAGKSITFQVPALMNEGICVVISPLISLMKDQVDGLKARRIKVAALYHGISHHEQMSILDNCLWGDYKLLYFSPERIGSEVFMAKLNHMNISMVVVDEAHCISQWGYDFRPSYLKIKEFAQSINERRAKRVPILALTATATPEVVGDIQQQLGFAQENAIQGSFLRKNLAYIKRFTDDRTSEAIHILSRVPGSAIIYTRSREKTAEIARHLISHGLSAQAYHAGLATADRRIRQEKWMKGEVRIMVATNAFGMGIDKPDVRIVIHFDIPPSLEEYFQEAGRAGRDGKHAYAVMLTIKSTRKTIMRRTQVEFPDKSFVYRVYELLAFFLTIAEGYGEQSVHRFDIDEFCQAYHIAPFETLSALRLLELAGYIVYNVSPNMPTRVWFAMTRQDLYRLDELHDLQEEVMQSLLRTYDGIFADYVFVSEHEIAQKIDSTAQLVAQALTDLARQGVIRYIPKNNEPLIYYPQERQPQSELHLPKEIYEERRERYVKRLKYILDYTERDGCRSSFMLNYFGERTEQDCGICDYCLGR